MHSDFLVALSGVSEQAAVLLLLFLIKKKKKKLDGLIGKGSSEGREPDDVAWLGFVKPDPLKASWQPQSPGMIVLMRLLFQN